MVFANDSGHLEDEQADERQVVPDGGWHSAINLQKRGHTAMRDRGSGGFCGVTVDA